MDVLVSTPKIQVRGLKKAFNGRAVLDGIDLDVRRGESMVIIGLSGVGKSVLIKCILGLLTPDEGEILVDGENWCELNTDERLQRMQSVGVVFQGAALFDSLPVWENVAFALLQRGMPPHEAKERASEVLELLELPGIEMKMPAELSGGMAKRVGLARAICHRPEMIFYDEPLTGLDPVMSDVISRLMIRLHNKFRVTSVTIAHDMNLARNFGDHIALLYHGRIHRLMEPSELDTCPDPIVRQFVEGHAEGPIEFQEETAMKQKEGRKS